MRRPTLIGLAAGGLLLVAAGGYTAFWFVAADRLEAGAVRLAAALEPRRGELTWQTLRVAGFPLALRLELGNFEFRDRAPATAGIVRAPRLTAGASPWNFAVWRLTAPDGVSATLGGGTPPAATLAAPVATGAILLPAAGGVTAWLTLDQPEAVAGPALTAQQADFWLIVPAQSPRSDADPAFGLAFYARGLTLPLLPATFPFANPLDELAAGVTVRGQLPSAPPREAAAAWRDAGGTADIDDLTLRWGGLTLTGSGTFALDGNLQPEGSFSAAIRNYPALLQALVATGQLRRRDAGLAGIALMLLAKPGPDGKPEISAPLRMQDGEMFLGPVKLGAAPHIDW